MAGFDRNAFLALGGAPAAAPPSRGFDRSAFLGLQGAGGAPAAPAAADDEDQPGLLEAGARGALQGVTFGFSDEIGGLLKSAFGDKTYKESRDEIRANDKAAREAHPWGYGLAEILGGAVVPGVGAGGAAARAGAGAVRTLGSAVRAGAATGAVSALGASEADLTQGDFAGALKDTATGAAVGGALAGGLHKVFGGYVDKAIDRRAKHLTEEISDGAVPTAKRRFGEVAKVSEKTGDSLAVSVIDSDKEFLRALKKGQGEARKVASVRLEDLGKKVTKIYDELDRETGGIPLGRVIAGMDEAVKKADVAGGAQVHSALEEARDQFLGVYRRKLDLEPGVDLATVPIPTQEVRQWVTRLKKQATTSMGSLSETERKHVKDEVAKTAKQILDGHLDEAAVAVPELEPTVAELRRLNGQILAYASADEAMKAGVKRKAWSPQSLTSSLGQAALPVAAVSAASDLVTGGATYLGTKAAMAAGKKLNKEATRALATLVRASRSGNVQAAEREAALRAGVPLALVYSVSSRTAGDGTPEEE